MREHQQSPKTAGSQLESKGTLSISPPAFSLNATQAGNNNPPPAQLNGGTAQLQPEKVNESGAAGDARALYKAMDGWGTDEAAIHRTLRGKSAAHLKRVMAIFAGYGKGSLQSWLSSELGGSDYKRAMTALWPALPVYERLKQQKGIFDDNEEAMVEVIVTASAADIRQASQDGRVRTFVHGELGYADQLKVAKILWPNEKYTYTVKFIRNADGWFWDDESTVISYLLDLSPAQRKQMWKENRSLFKMFSGYQSKDANVAPHSAFGNVMKVCLGTQAEALAGAMEYATDGLGTADDLVKKVVEETGKAVQQEQTLNNALNGKNSAKLTESQRTAMQNELQQLGGVKKNLLEVDDNNSTLAKGSFLEMLKNDVSGSQFEAMTAQMGMDEFDRAKQMILDAVGWWDDNEKVYRAIESIKSQALRDKLMADKDIKKAMGHLNDSEKSVANAFAKNDTYAIAVHKIANTNSWMGRDYGEFFNLLVAMTPADRARFAREHVSELNWIRIRGSATVKAALAEIMETGKLSPQTAMAYATVGAGTADTFLTDTLKNMNAKDRMMYRAGYALSRGHKIPFSFMDKKAQGHARAEFDKLYAMMAGDLSHDDLQKALDDLVSAPTLPEYTKDGGYELITFILQSRVKEKAATRDGGLSDGFVDMFTNTGGVADVAEISAMSHYNTMMADGKVSDPELMEMGRLEKEFGKKHEEYVTAIDTVADVASTVAAIAAAVAVTVFTAGTGAPAAAGTLSAYLGGASASTVVAAAAAGGTAKLVVSEAVGGEHNSVAEEGAADFMIGGVEGAMTAMTAGLAKSLHSSFGSLLGLRGTALASEMTAGTLRATSVSLSNLGKQFGTGAVRGAIEGVLSGAVGELVVTAMDEETYRKSIWDTLVNFGTAIARGAAMGGFGGAIGGGAMDAFGLVLGSGRARALVQKLTATGFSAEHLDKLMPHQLKLIAQADAAIQAGDWSKAHRLIQSLERQLSPEDAARMKRGLLAQHGDTRLAATQSAPGGQYNGRYMHQVEANDFNWNEVKYEGTPQQLAFEAARKELMSSSQDTRRVMRALKNLGVNLSEADVATIKNYLFGDDTAIGLFRENYDAWRRLVRGEGTLQDARFLVHENFEIHRMRELGKDMNFDPTGRSLGKYKNRTQWQHDWNKFYNQAHQEALQVEYKWLQRQMRDIAGVEMSLPELVVADSRRLHSTTPESYATPSAHEFQHNRPHFEGVPLNEHHYFATWVGKATQPVQISQEVADKLGLSSTTVPRYQLIPALKRFRP